MIGNSIHLLFIFPAKSSIFEFMLFTISNFATSFWKMLYLTGSVIRSSGNFLFMLGGFISNADSKPDCDSDGAPVGLVTIKSTLLNGLLFPSERSIPD